LINIGVLALQGDFARHAEVIRKLGHHPVQVRVPDTLDTVRALIIPGGESTTLQKLFLLSNFDEAIRKFSGTKPVMGTCAGSILLSKNADRLERPPLGLIDIDVHRNAYGRQKESFLDDIEISLNGTVDRFQGVFIRAPRITRTGSHVEILGRYGDEIVMAAEGRILVCTFHPELTNNVRIHQYFVDTFIAP
jgi:5'-phosphate synthase pdxT subunit